MLPVSIQPFADFPINGLHFLEELAENNNREWFKSHEHDYLDQVLEPAQSFVMAIGERLKMISAENTTSVYIKDMIETIVGRICYATMDCTFNL